MLLQVLRIFEIPTPKLRTDGTEHLSEERPSEQKQIFRTNRGLQRIYRKRRGLRSPSGSSGGTGVFKGSLGGGEAFEAQTDLLEEQ
ncbi:hypothetical protein QR680_004534 [Steinernema hermaphroditum]|uniref:Uncharacterized protein n=1 Tax=Steinernema hermaphroditum TaxID=289476 RepID=A0AA39HP00_9BILA|nr:hypothetical protein QR680_004534 [Steinernema hermaphroditum]